MVLSIPQSTVHGSTETSLIPVNLCAIDQLLLAQVNKLARLLPVGELHDTRRSESIVRATDVLILDGCDRPCFHPVDMLDLGLWVVALSAEFTLLYVIAGDEVTLSLGPI